MFKLPVCPHCGTVYRFRDTVKAVAQKENVCYHCQKKFKAKFFPDILVAAAIAIAASIGMNLLILSRITSFNLFPLFAVTIGLLLLVILVIPFFTRFKKIEEAPKYPKQRSLQNHQKSGNKKKRKK